MRILIAGATGALGSRLVPLLVKADHEVFGTSRNQAGLAGLNAQGATGVVMDGLDPDSVQAAVAEAKPEVIVHQLTALGAMTGNPKKFDRDFAVTNRLRTEGTGHLLAAARDAGVRRFVAQSFTTWPNERTGGWVKTEDDPLIEDPGKEARQSLRAIRYLERAVTTAPGIEGLVLRYGNFYGPGKAASRTGSMGEMIRRGRFPIVGGGTGVWRQPAGRVRRVDLEGTVAGSRGFLRRRGPCPTGTGAIAGQGSVHSPYQLLAGESELAVQVRRSSATIFDVD